MRDLRSQTQPTCGTTGMVSRCGIPRRAEKEGCGRMERDSSAATRDFQRKCECLRLPFPFCPPMDNGRAMERFSPRREQNDLPGRRSEKIGSFLRFRSRKEHPAETIRLRSRKRGKEMTSTGHPANSHGKRTTAKSKRKWREQTGAAIPLRSPREKDHPFSGFQRSFFGDHGENPPCSRRSCGRDAFGSDFPEPLPAANPSLHLPGLRPLPERRDKGTITGPEILFDVRPDAGKTLK